MPYTKQKRKTKKTKKVRRNNTLKRKAKPVPLIKQIKDNDWMKEILIRKANNQPLNDYDTYLFNTMKKQPLPKGGMTSLIKRYKNKRNK